MEISCIAALVLMAWQGGKCHLRNWHGPAGSLTNDLFIPALMMNASEGFTNVDPQTILGMRSFLDFQSDTFDLQKIPDGIEKIPLHPYQEFHRYLVYSVAAAWWFWGVSWDAIKSLLVVYLFLSCLSVYGICRLGMNPLLALAVTLVFVFTPAVYTTLPILRDFAKAPFILGVAFLLGILAFKRTSPAQFLICALPAGLLLGIGMGIRRDMMILLPISIAFLFLGKIKTPTYNILVRLAALGLLLSAFVLAGWPIHKSLMQSGYLAAHDTIMGFSSYSDQETGLLSPASYEKHYLLNDMYSTIKAHYAAGMGATFSKTVYQEQAAEPAFDLEVKDAYVRKIIHTFPADMLSRTYAAILRATVGISSTPAALERFGFWFVLATLLLIASQNPLRAWILLGMLCYFCGYTSLQYAPRHAFHLSFVPFFFIGFLIQQGWDYLLGKRAASAVMQAAPHQYAKWKPTLRSAVWLAITGALFILPLAAAKHAQRQSVSALVATYETAPLEHVPHTIMNWGNESLIVPTLSVHAEGFDGKCLLEDFSAGVVVAAFSNVKMPLNVRAVYEWNGGIGDFGGAINTAIRGDDPTPAKLFFPVYEKTSHKTDWSRFVGLALPSEALAFFQGLYKVKDLNNLTLMVNLLLPENHSQMIFSQPVYFPWRGCDQKVYSYFPEFDLFPKIFQIQEHIRSKNLESAVELALKAKNEHPGTILFPLLLANSLELQGKQTESYQIFLELLEIFPNLPVVYALMDDFFYNHGGDDRRLASWAAILADKPDSDFTRNYFENAAQAASEP